MIEPNTEMDRILLGNTRDLKEIRELVAVIPSQQNLKGICISVLVIKVVLGLVTLSVFLMTPPDLGPRVHGARMSIHNLTSDTFKPNNFNATWVSDSQVAFLNGAGNLEMFDATTHKRVLLVSKDVFRSIGGNDYSLSPDLQWVMVRHKIKMDSFPQTAMYTLQNISSHTNPLMSVSVSNDVWLQHAQWTKTGGIIVVYKNNIFYKQHVSDETWSRVTRDGVPGVMFNGVNDWIYRDSILRSRSSIWLSDDGKLMAFLKLNDSLVPTLSYTQLDTIPIEPENQIRYAKSSGASPDVSLHVYNFVSRQVTLIQPPQTLSKRSFYITDVKWLSNQTLFCSWVSKGITSLIQTTASQQNKWHLNEIYSTDMSSRIKAILSVENIPVFSADLNSFLSVLPVYDEPTHTQESVSDQKEIVSRKLSMSSTLSSDQVESPEQQVWVSITQGRLELSKILSWDDNNSTIYFVAQDSEKRVHLYKSSTHLSSAPHIPECITCKLPRDCDVSRVHMSPENSFFIQECLGASVPYLNLIDTKKGEIVITLDNNTKIHESILNVSIPQETEIRMSSAPNFPIKIFLPPGYRKTDEFIFPLLIHFESETAYHYKVGWNDYLSSKRDIVVAHLPSKLDIDVAYNIIRQLLSSELEYIDPFRVAIYGAGIGGWKAANILMKDHKALNPVIQCGILQSPVVDWAQHDAFFTDKYLGQAGTNSTDHLSLLNKITELPSKCFYLVHEPGNWVMLPQSLMFSRALVDNDILFKQQIYLERTEEVAAMKHMYKSMEHYLETCLGPFEDHFRDDYFLASMEMGLV